MKDSDITTPEQAEAALHQQTLDRHRQLWQQAEGRNNWVYVCCIIAAAMLFGAGLAGDWVESDDRLMFVALGLVMFCQAQFVRGQSQSAATRKLIERLEQRVTRLEKSEHG